MLINRMSILSGQREAMVRIAPGFPVSVDISDFSRDDYERVDWHWHEDFQLSLVTKGQVRFHVVDREMVLPEGTGIFINAGLVHSSEGIGEDSGYQNLNFLPEIVCSARYAEVFGRVLKPVEDSEALPFFLFSGERENGKNIIKCIEEIAAFSDRKETAGWELLVSSRILELWPSVLSEARAEIPPVNVQSNERLQKILVYLEEHYPEKIMLQDVADEVHLCAEECTRFFKRTTGRTLFDFLIRYRLDRSLDLLVNEPGLSVSDIAFRCGFSSQSYYNICFKKFLNTTPGSYRRKMLSSRSL